MSRLSTTASDLRPARHVCQAKTMSITDKREQRRSHKLAVRISATPDSQLFELKSLQAHESKGLVSEVIANKIQHQTVVPSTEKSSLRRVGFPALAFALTILALLNSPTAIAAPGPNAIAN